MTCPRVTSLADKTPSLIRSGVKSRPGCSACPRIAAVKRREDLTEAERGDLQRALGYLPAPATLRRFADRIYWLFDAPKDAQQAGCRWSAVLRCREFHEVPELAKAMEQRGEGKFSRLMAFLNDPVGRGMRTNNHAERTNRAFRLLEKVRDKSRRRRTLVRFVVMTLDVHWATWTPPQPQTESADPVNRTRRPPQGVKTSRLVA